MLPIPAIALTTALIGAGALAWLFAGRSLISNPDLNVPLNPLGIQRSPYGEVIAMALQGPVDAFFDAGVSGEEPILASQPETPPVSREFSLNARFSTFLASLDQASTARTNPKAASAALKRHLRRQAEDKLRFAYQLDPAHYGNYNSLHFFLTEPALGTHPELTPSAAKLADDTIQYCLRQDHDPRPALTAAAAATNVLHLMFNDHHLANPRFSTTQMRQYLNLLDHCLARYANIAHEWDLSKNWDLLSPQRITECQERFYFISKIRDAASQTILLYEHKALPKATATPDSTDP